MHERSLRRAQRNNKYNYANLPGLSKADSVVTQIVDRVPSSQESITQNGEGPYGLREVHSHESTNARALNFKNIIERTDFELVTGEGESKVWKRITFVALNRVLSVPSLLGSNLLVQKFGQSGWESNPSSISRHPG